MIEGLVADVFLRLNVTFCSQRLHPGLRSNRICHLTLHGDKREPVSRDILVRRQLQLTGKAMGMVCCCKRVNKVNTVNEKLAHYTTRGSIQNTEPRDLTPTSLPLRHLRLLFFIWQNLLYKATRKNTES